MHRIFVTNLKDRLHQVAAWYDKRAAAKNLIGEAQREGVLAIPSNNFHANHAFFQLVMLAYNLWRWTKLLAGACDNPGFNPGLARADEQPLGLPDHTNRLARLKLLFVAAKVQFHAGQARIRYSMHDDRAEGLMRFLRFLDKRRKKLRRTTDSIRSSVQKAFCTNATVEWSEAKSGFKWGNRCKIQVVTRRGRPQAHAFIYYDQFPCCFVVCFATRELSWSPKLRLGR